MFRPRLRGRCGRWGLLSLPVLGWVLLVLLVPTGWVRTRLVARLEVATGRSVRMGSIQLGWTGNLRIEDLSLAERSTPTDPWLQVTEARVDIHLGQVLFGCCTPSEITVEGLSVRIWRRLDGRFEFGDLARCPSSGAAGPAKGGVNLLPAVNVRVNNALIRYVDDASGLQLNLRGVVARGSYQAQLVRIDNLLGELNGGPLTLAAELIRDPKTPRFSAEVQVRRVHLDQGINVVETLVPLVGREGDSAGGLLTARLAIRGQGASPDEIRRTLTGHGTILLDPIDLDGSRILAELRTLGEWPRENHIGAVSSSFVVDRGRVLSDDLTIRASKIPLVVAGWTDFDGRFDYTTRIDKILASLPRDARALMSELQVNLDELTSLRIEGQRDQVRMTLNGRPLASDSAPTNGERVRFRESARKIRDRFFR